MAQWKAEKSSAQVDILPWWSMERMGEAGKSASQIGVVWDWQIARSDYSEKVGSNNEEVSL